MAHLEELSPREKREQTLRKLERVDALELALQFFEEDHTKREYVFFVMLEFVDEKKMVIDTKKVTIATKKINYHAFTVLQKVVPMDHGAYAEMHKTFGLRMNSGRKKYKIPSTEDIVQPWAAAIKARLADDAQYEAELEERAAAVSTAMSAKKMGAALKAALKDPPVKCKNLDLKTRSAELVFRVLKSVSGKGMEKHSKNLNPEQQDNLMRYIYRGLSDPSNAKDFLKWHAAVVNAAGLGVINRVLCGPLV